MGAHVLVSGNSDASRRDALLEAGMNFALIDHRRRFDSPQGGRIFGLSLQVGGMSKAATDLCQQRPSLSK